MIPNGEKWHYIAVKKISALLRGITSKNNGFVASIFLIRLEKKQS